MKNGIIGLAGVVGYTDLYGLEEEERKKFIH